MFLNAGCFALVVRGWGEEHGVHLPIGDVYRTGMCSIFTLCACRTHTRKLYLRQVGTLSLLAQHAC